MAGLVHPPPPTPSCVCDVINIHKNIIRFNLLAHKILRWRSIIFTDQKYTWRTDFEMIICNGCDIYSPHFHISPLNCPANKELVGNDILLAIMFVIQLLSHSFFISCNLPEKSQSINLFAQLFGIMME